MQEFDDLQTQIQLVKNKMVQCGYYSQELAEPLEKESGNSYEYLIYKALYSGFNKPKLKARMREIYFDLTSGSFDDVDLYDIVEALDEENMAIIIAFYKGLRYEETDIDNIIAHYYHDIGCMLDDWVEDVLREEGYFYKGMSLMKVFQKNHDKINSFTDLEGQNVMNPEWL